MIYGRLLSYVPALLVSAVFECPEWSAENVSGCSDSVLPRILLLPSSVHGTAKYMSRPGARLIVGWRNRLVRPGWGVKPTDLRLT
jgi:hypothetical protein